MHEKETPALPWKWMQLCRFHVRASSQANAEILHRWARQILNISGHPVLCVPLLWGSRENLQVVLWQKECRWTGSKRRRFEAVEHQAGETPAYRHAVRIKQITISVLKTTRILVIGQAIALELLQHYSCRENIQGRRQTGTCTMPIGGFLLERPSNLRWENLSTGHVVQYESDNSIIKIIDDTAIEYKPSGHAPCQKVS